MDFLRIKKDEIVVYANNSVYLNGSPWGKLTLEELGVPEERMGEMGTTQTFYYKGTVIHAWVNLRQVTDAALKRREYRQRHKMLCHRVLAHR